MERSENALHGKVVAKYGSIAGFAKACDISYSKAYRIIMDANARDLDDARLLIRALQLKDAEEIVSLFSLS